MFEKEKYNETKERIRTCAIDLFKQNGFEHVTIMQICHAAGVTKRTFYYHFESKDQLLNGITDSLGIKAESILNELVSQQSNVGMLWSLMSVYSSGSLDLGPNILKPLYMNILQGNTQERFPYSTYLYSTVVRTIENAQKNGEIPNTLPAENIAFSLYHSLRSISITWAAENGEIDLAKEFRRIFYTILGILPPDEK